MSESAGGFWGWPGWGHLRFCLFVSAIGMMWFGFVYVGCDALTAHRATRVRIHLNTELNIPFVPESVVIYMSLYLLFLAAPFALRQRREFLALALSLDLIILLAGVCFLLIPAQLAFPPQKNFGLLDGLFRFADRLNLTYNLVPSLHVALATACVAAFGRKTCRRGKLLLWMWVSGIAASTLLTHQHHLLDVVSGLGLALAVDRWFYAAWLEKPDCASAHARR